MEILLKALATWRISHMLVHEDGPYEMWYGLRIKSGIRYGFDGKPSQFGGLSPLHCLLCTSLWVSPILYLLPIKYVMPWAISGIAILIEEVVTWLGHQYEQSSH